MGRASLFLAALLVAVSQSYLLPPCPLSQWAAPPPSLRSWGVKPGGRVGRGQLVRMHMDGNDRNGGEERPKAKKQPLVAAAPVSKENDETFEAHLLRTVNVMGQAMKDLFSTPVENYALLLGDICVLLGFRMIEDIMMSPVPRLDIDAYPDAIEKGLGLYAEPSIAVGHVFQTVVDGMALGLFWMSSTVLGRNENVEMKATLDHRVSALLTFRTWLTASNLRLVVLLMQAVHLEQHIDLSLVQLELFGTLTTMLAWRALYTFVMRLIL